MKKLFGLLGLLGVIVVGLGAMQFNSGTDPCMNPNVHKDSVSFSFSSATATAAVPTPSAVRGVTPQRIIYVCGLYATTTGSTPAIQLGAALTNACSTPVALTGAMTAPFLEITNPGIAVPLSTGSPQALCITVSGGSPSVQGVLTYVQQ